MASLFGKSVHHEESSSSSDQDLTTMLSPSQRSDLVILIVQITDSMRKQLIEDTFSSPQFSNSQRTPIAATDKNPNLSSDKNPNVTTEKSINLTTYEIEEKVVESTEDENARKSAEKRERELAAPDQVELKNASEAFFQSWQESVILRLGEKVNHKEGKEAQEEKDHFLNETEADGRSEDVKDKVIEPNTNVEDANDALIELYPPMSTSLVSLPKDKRVVLLRSMLLLLLSLEHYSSYSRVLLLHLVSSLHLSLHILAEAEVNVAQGLIESAKHMSGDAEAKKRGEENSMARKWKVGLAGVAGAAIIGVTGGLAAPLVAAGLGTVLGGLGLGATAGAALLGTLAQSGVIVGALFGAYGGRMTGQMMDAYAKEVQDFAFLPLKGDTKKRNWRGAEEASPQDRRLRVIIGVSGWLTRKEDIIDAWRVLGHQSEVFALRWELDALMNLGTSLESVVKSYAWGIAKKEIIARTVFASLAAAMWPIGLLKVSKIIDNPFSVAKNRADKAGLVLADAIINRAQGERPVTLIGYSLGARMIYTCLTSLASRKAFGLVESAVLIGAPAPSDSNVWRAMRSVVAGRLVNVYSENDYILAYLYRTSSIQFGIAGIQEVADVPSVQNVDVSKIVSGHLRYPYLVGSILEKIGWEDLDLKQVAREEETLALLEKEDEKAEVANQKESEGSINGKHEVKEKSSGTKDVEEIAAMEKLEIK